MTIISHVVEFFLPVKMRNNPTDLMRGYTLIGLSSTNIISCLLVGFGLIYFLDLQENTRIGVGLNFICAAGYLIALILLRNTENFLLCANFLLGTLAVVNFTAIQITGGYLESPIVQVTALLPITAFLLLGLRAGLVWLAITSLLCLATYISARVGVGYVQLLGNQSVIEGMYVMLNFVMLLMIGGALTIYELMNGLLTKTLDEERSRFEHKASHDDLTGIPNRFEYFRRIKAVIAEAKDRDQKVGVVYIDLDGFKPVNDELGHHMGDEVLRVVAERLQRVLRLSDTTARLGGDEFALILPGINVPSDVERILPKVLAAIREPIRVEDQEVVVYGSCGVAIFPDHSQDHAELCRLADQAMYAAKDESDAYLVFEGQTEAAFQPA